MKREVSNNVLNFFNEVQSGINNWLIFAESKNAALIAFNVAITGMALEALDTCKYKAFIMFCCLLSSLSILICLLSFYPHTEGSNKKKREKQNNISNLTFYGDIATFSSKKYIIDVYDRYFNEHITEKELTSREIDLASEIIINSKITVHKYELFKKALIFSMGSIICLVCTLIFK